MGPAPACLRSKRICGTTVLSLTSAARSAPRRLGEAIGPFAQRSRRPMLIWSVGSATSSGSYRWKPFHPSVKGRKVIGGRRLSLSPFFLWISPPKKVPACLAFDIILIAAVCVFCLSKAVREKTAGASMFTIGAGLSSLALIWELLPDDAPSPDQAAAPSPRRHDALRPGLRQAAHGQRDPRALHELSEAAQKMNGDETTC
jgi:hypothetical protein